MASGVFVPDSSRLAPAASGRRWRPGPVLRSFVAGYSRRVDRLGSTRVYNPLPARSDCFLQLYLGDRYEVVTVASGAVHLAPRFVLVGPHTSRREDLVWAGHLRCFTIRFTPVGFRALFGVPAKLIANYAGDATMVLGAVAIELAQRLSDAAEAELGPVAERFLMTLLLRLAPRARVPDQGVVAYEIAMELRRRHGSAAIAELAARNGMSVRQVERGFLEYVGTSPKEFAQLERLKRALMLSASAQKPDWAEIACAAGYFDQSHMGRVFRGFNGATPAEFHGLMQRARRSRSGDVAFVLSECADGD